jgi:hypothetical protein
MDVEVTVNVTLSTGLEPINAEVTLQGLEYPYETYFAVTPASGTVVFDEVWKGRYDLTVIKIGYELYKLNNVLINSDRTFDVLFAGEEVWSQVPVCRSSDA